MARSTERTEAARVAAEVGLPARMRPRRTCHAVPGSSERFLAKAADLRSVAVSWGAFSEDTLRVLAAADAAEQ